jgi:ubiquinone/menaquinone biosynthesis C-methylase UbiE
VSPPDRWTSGIDYEGYVGRWSRLVAAEFLSWLDAPPGGRWLDVGSGTGALTECILASTAPASVLGVEPSAGFVEHARAHVPDPRARFETGSADAVPLPDDAVDLAVAGLVLNFVPDLAAGLAELARVVVPGGTIAGYVWDYAGRMELMKRFWDAAVELDPAAASATESSRFRIAAPDPLRAAFEEAGLTAVEVRPIDVPTVFRDFDDYWSPFLSGVAPAPGYAMGLAEDRRTELRERLRSTLPTEPDGSIRLVARAWAVRGRTPGGGEPAGPA